MVRNFIAVLESGECAPENLIERCRRRIAESEGHVRAWASLADDPPCGSGRLRGLPFGAKDIFDSRDLPTTYGSSLYAGHRPIRNAALIEELIGAGAVLLGKTHTTAFASFDPAPTRNPRLAGHTPGGSSSGSAAAVAAGMVPFAIGTQTLGSVLRPAAYCGVCGFKPSFGLIPIQGALPFAPSLDTIGFFTQTADDMVCLWSRGFDGVCEAPLSGAARFRLPGDDAVSDAAERLRAAGVPVLDLDPPEGWEQLLASARIVNAYEGARSHAERLREFGDRLGVRLVSLLREGMAIPTEQYEAAVAQIGQMRGVIAQIFWEYPAILNPTAGPPPAGYESTGDPSLQAPWTALGVPAITIPLPGGGLPRGLQVTAAWGRDDALLSVAAQAEKLIHAATI